MTSEPSATPNPPTNYIVRHGSMRFLGEFTAREQGPFPRLTDVIVHSERGQEWGQVLCPAHARALQLLTEPTRGHILRIPTPDDHGRRNRIAESQRAVFEGGLRLIGARRLPMELVDVEQTFGGERIVFYFLAEKRVDFRELVKDMAREFQMRIELRQIGVRDEAKLKADYGDCGKPVCCNTHMTVMPPVSMRMAKIQKSTLDPSKISGRCGRLKCCLRFEQDVYDDFLTQLPSIGTRILTKKGQGRVLAQEILARRLLVEFEDGRRLPVALDEVLTKL